MEYILKKIIKLDEVVKIHPELFDFSKLDIEDKAKLLDSNTKFYIDKIPVHNLPLRDKAYLLLRVKSKAFQKTVTMTVEEVHKLLPQQYLDFLKRDFKQYITKEKFEGLSRYQQGEIFTMEPEWVIENIEKTPKLTSDKLEEIATKNPAFIDKHIIDYSEFSTSYHFWIKMMKYNKKYEETFLKNTNSCITTADVRNVCRNKPELIKKLDKDILANSKLTCKQWVLLCNEIMGNNEKLFESWEFSDDLIDIFKLDLMAEMLTGKSKLSKRFQNAVKYIFEKEEDETETVV